MTTWRRVLARGIPAVAGLVLAGAAGAFAGTAAPGAEGPARAEAPHGAALRAPAAPMPPAASAERALLDRYCVACHNTRLQTAGLALDAADVDHVAADPALWEKVVRKLRAGGDAAGAAAASGRGGLRRLHRAAGDGARRGGRRRPGPGADGGLPPAEPRRVPQRRPRPAGPRGRRGGAAPGRRRELRLRQHRGRARHVADAAGALSVGGEEGEPPRGREPRPAADRRDVPSRSRLFPGRSDRRAAVRHPRRHRDPLHLPGRRGVRHPLATRPGHAGHAGRLRDPARARGEPGRRPAADVPRWRAAARRRPGGATSTARGATGSGTPTRTGCCGCRCSPDRARCAPRSARRRPRTPRRCASRTLRPYTNTTGGDTRYQPYLASVVITGPYEASDAPPIEETPSRARIFTCRPADGDAAGGAGLRPRDPLDAGPPRLPAPGDGPRGRRAARLLRPGGPRAASRRASSWRCGGCWSAPSSSSASSATRSGWRRGRPTG